VKTLEAYKHVMFSLIKQHRDVVIDSPGDNLLAEFASVLDAVQCGAVVPKEVQTRNADLPENRNMQFRIGINLGLGDRELISDAVKCKGIRLCMTSDKRAHHVEDWRIAVEGAAQDDMGLSKRS
jgi:hypothetical protein